MIFVLFAIAAVFVLLRLYQRFHDKALRTDNALCIIALVSSIFLIHYALIVFRQLMEVVGNGSKNVITI
jgi:hypothetical protein